MDGNGTAFTLSGNLFYKLNKNLLPVKKIRRLLRSPKPTTFVGGKNLDFCLPHLILWTQMTGCFTKQLLPSNLYYQLENRCYPNSSLPRTFCTELQFSIHVHHAYLNTGIAQNIWVNSTLTHQVGGYFYDSVWFCWHCDSAELVWFCWV